MTLIEKLYAKRISDREIQVIKLVNSGITNKEVGSILRIEEKTVKFHLTNIFKKLQVSGRANLPARIKEINIGIKA